MQNLIRTQTPEERAVYLKDCLEKIEKLLPLLEEAEDTYNAVRIAENNVTQEAMKLIDLLEARASRSGVRGQIQNVKKNHHDIFSHSAKLEQKVLQLNSISRKIGLDPMQLRGCQKSYKQELDNILYLFPKDREGAPRAKKSSSSDPGELRSGISNSFNEINFWRAFEKDLDSARKSVLIVSPFLYPKRTEQFLDVFKELLGKGIKVQIYTDCIHVEQEGNEEGTKRDGESRKLREEAYKLLQETGVDLICYHKCHQKVAIIDEALTWEGSLNILSHSKKFTSREQMRRFEGWEVARDSQRNLRLDARGCQAGKPKPK
ncbi:MAG: phospholipase D-like domain-containing protein [Cyanobacteriota/Melainabacteria group bacterium]